MKLLNAFSVNMLQLGGSVHRQVEFQLVSTQRVRALLSRGFESAVGHADTARIFGQILDLPVEANRTTVTLASGEKAILGQYIGPRLPEGATALPEKARIDWIIVTVK
jgi:hypothetical protein